MPKLCTLPPFCPLQPLAPSGLSPVETAFKAGDTEGVYALLRSCAPNNKDQNGLTALMWAAFIGRPELVSELILSSNVQALTSYYAQALSVAAEKGHVSCVKVLLPHSNPWARGGDKGSALDCAARAGQLECLTLLIDYNPDFLDQTARQSNLGVCAVIAAGRGHLDCLLHLMHLGALDAGSTWVVAALHDAALSGRVNTIRAILSHAPHQPEVIASTLVVTARSFHPAANEGATDEQLEACIELLTQALPQGSAYTEELCFVALCWLAGLGRTSCLKQVLPLCPSLAGRSGPGPGVSYGSPLGYAALGGSQSCVEVLLPFSDLDALDEKGRNPRKVAIDGGFPELGAFIESERSRRESLILNDAATRADPMRLTPTSRL